MTWLTNWNYRKPITISNSGSALTDYQINATVSYVSSMQSNFNDIRFTDIGGNILPYWIESKTDSTSANVWIKASSILASPSTTTIYLYYDNSSATSVSSYFDTFDVLGNGSSGSLTVTSLNTVVNTYTYLTGNQSSGSTTITINSGTGFSNGDEILIIQMQNYSGGTAGQYEFKKISSGGGTTSFTLDTPLKGSYTSGTFNSANATVTQIVRIPQYTNITINSGASITASAWDGYKGGIVTLRANGTITANGNIDTSGKGFRGGTGIGTGGPATQGESYKGLGTLSNSANYGGGAGGQNTSDGSTGSYGTQGMTAVAQQSSTYGTATLNEIMLGSGGGGTQNNATRAGCVGGGITFVFANTLTNNNSILSKSASPTTDYSLTGSGGSIYITSGTISVGTTNAAGIASNGYTSVVSGSGRIRLSANSISGTSTPSAYMTGFDTVHNRKYASPEPTLGTTGTEELGITATAMNISQSETPCRTGICTITANVTWQNLGSSSVTFRPTIILDGITYVQAVSDITIGAYPLTGSSSITTPTLSVGTHSICPYPN